jgi:hypothetical protein
MLEKQHMITWTTETTNQICELIESGKSINSFAGKKGMPSAPSIYRRMVKDPEFAALIQTARAAQQEAEMDKCIQLADSATPETVHVIRLQIWARQWRASRLFPKRWGDKASMEITGRDGAPISTQQIALSDDQEAALQKLIATAQERARKQ